MPIDHDRMLPTYAVTVYDNTLPIAVIAVEQCQNPRIAIRAAILAHFASDSLPRSSGDIYNDRRYVPEITLPHFYTNSVAQFRNYVLVAEKVQFAYHGAVIQANIAR